MSSKSSGSTATYQDIPANGNKQLHNRSTATTQQYIHSAIAFITVSEQSNILEDSHYEKANTQTWFNKMESDQILCNSVSKNSKTSKKKGHLSAMKLCLSENALECFLQGHKSLLAFDLSLGMGQLTRITPTSEQGIYFLHKIDERLASLVDQRKLSCKIFLKSCKILLKRMHLFKRLARFFQDPAR